MRHFNLLLSLPLFVLTVACGSGRPATHESTPAAALPGASAPANPSTPTSVTWAFWGDPHEVTIDQSIVRLFEKEHPEIHVATSWTDYNDYQAKFADWSRSENPPDVAFLSDIPAWAPSGILANLQPYIDADIYDVKDFYPGLLDLFRYQNDLYGLPRDNDTKVIFYNKDLFDAAKLSYPHTGWTWADLRNDALALTASEGAPRYGFAFETQAWWKLWVWQNGGDVYDDDNHPTRSALNTPQAVGALRFLRDLIYIDHVTPPPADLASSDKIGSLFASGKLAMAFGNRALVPLFAGTQDLHWGVVSLPQGAQAVNWFGGAGYVISARSAHKEAAWTFLKWLLSSKGEAVFTESGLIVPSRISVGNSKLFLHPTTPQGQSAQGPEIGRTFLDETKLGHGLPAFPGSTEIASAIDSGLSPIWSQGADPQAVVAALTPRIDVMLGAPR